MPVAKLLNVIKLVNPIDYNCEAIVLYITYGYKTRGRKLVHIAAVGKAEKNDK